MLKVLRNTLYTALLIGSALAAEAQVSWRFRPSSAATMQQASGQVLALGTSGGLNNPQLYSVDLNGDGVKDMIVFDRDGDRWLALERINGQWIERPTWTSNFPTNKQWVHVVDYNCDGIPDIFGWVVHGVGVWQGQRTNGILSFTWALGPLTELRSVYTAGSPAYNLQVLSVDRPYIGDIDQDGDIDVLCFDQGGTKIEWHQNQQNCGLTFVRADGCWGDVEESGVRNALVIDACIASLPPRAPQTEDVKHAGSTLLLHDMTGNGLPDALIGDVSYESGVVGFNVGTLAQANIESQDSTWPAANNPVNLMFPGFSAVDVNLDGVSEIVASPNMYSGSADSCVWLYQNNGSATAPVWQRTQTRFLQDEMVELGTYSVPYGADLNTDGLVDLIIGSRRGLSYWVNYGTISQPVWRATPITTPSNLGPDPTWTAPALGDLNADGLVDMAVGRTNGQVYVAYNSGTLISPSFSGSAALLTNHDVGQNASPELFDLDVDGDLDLLIGNEKGEVAFLRNDAGAWNLVSTNFGSIDVDTARTFNGRSVPRAYLNGGQMELWVGSRYAGVLAYPNASSILALPPSLSPLIQTANAQPTATTLQTPFGGSRRTGRHQYLIKASELAAAGISGPTRIQGLKVNCITSSAPYLSQGFTVSVRHSNDQSLGGMGPGGEVGFSYLAVLSQGWNFISFQNPIDYDGQSNLVVEFCFSRNLPSSDVHLAAHRTPFASHAFGDVANHNSILSDGCAMPGLGTDSLRIDLEFLMTPRLQRGSTMAHDGSLNAPWFGDLDSDGRPELVLGVGTGGIRYMTSDTNQIGSDEGIMLPSQLDVYPNPGTEWLQARVETRVRVLTLDGRFIGEFAIGPNQALNTRSWPAGVYLLWSPEGVARWIKLP